MLSTLAEGFTLGLATGSTCLATCSPIYLPFLMSEDRSIKKSLMLIFEISIGRFLAYLLFGAIAGFIGSQYQAANREIFTSIAYILLSGYLVLTAYSSHQNHKKCHIPKVVKWTQNPFLLGVLTGINFCPSFLIALSNAVDLGGSVDGMMLFGGFFTGTTLFLIPFAFISQLAKIKNLKLVAQVASLIIAVWFVGKGVKGFYHYFNEKNVIATKRLVDVYNPTTRIFVITSEINKDYFENLYKAILSEKKKHVEILTLDEASTMQWEDYPILLIDNTLDISSFNAVDRFLVQPGFSISTILKYLKGHTFRTEKFVDFKLEN